MNNHIELQELEQIEKEIKELQKRRKRLYDRIFLREWREKKKKI